LLRARLHLRLTGNRPIQWRNKPITAAVQSLDISRCVRVIAQRLPNLADAKVEPMLEIYERLLTPYLLFQSFPGNQLSWLAQQDRQDFCRLRSQPYLSPEFTKLACLLI